jgi:glycosyltransferase involved in cell wall biosynthesis
MTEEYPLVSAIMLAGRTSHDNVREAIECFQAQTYPYKELVIVNNAKNQLEASAFNISAQKDVFVIDTPQHLTAGMARNYGISAANGRILAQFDPDFWFDPDRISVQVAAMGKNNTQISMLTKTLNHSFITGRSSYSTNPQKTILNTMVFIRPKDADYPNIDKNEEFGLLNKLNNDNYKIVSVDNPNLACKLQYSDNPILKIKSNCLNNKKSTKIIQSIINSKKLLFSNI